MGERLEYLVIGNRVPKDFFITSGVGESDITDHAGSFHLALTQAGIQGYNVMQYSSILPGIATEVEQPREYVHGSVLESIMAQETVSQGERATAAIIFGWLFNRETHERFGGLVCEYHGSDPRSIAEESLRASLNELYVNGYEESYTLDPDSVRVTSRSFTPRKKFGTALVALGFVNYVVPILSGKASEEEDLRLPLNGQKRRAERPLQVY